MAYVVLTIYQLNGWYVALILAFVIFFLFRSRQKAVQHLNEHLQRVSEEYPLDFKLKQDLDQIQDLRRLKKHG